MYGLLFCQENKDSLLLCCGQAAMIVFKSCVLQIQLLHLWRSFLRSFLERTARVLRDKYAVSDGIYLLKISFEGIMKD